MVRQPSPEVIQRVKELYSNGGKQHEAIGVYRGWDAHKIGQGYQYYTEKTISPQLKAIREDNSKNHYWCDWLIDFL
jgi:hypothetical protein